MAWPQWMTHINHILYPRDSPDDRDRRMRNQDDEYSTLFRYPNWNNGFNYNLKQLINEAFPSYHVWSNIHVMLPYAMFRGPSGS